MEHNDGTGPGEHAQGNTMIDLQSMMAEFQNMMMSMEASAARHAQEAEERHHAAIEQLRREHEEHLRRYAENLPRQRATSPRRGETSDTLPQGQENTATSVRRDTTEQRASLALPLGLPPVESTPRPKEPDTFDGNRAKLNSFENQMRGFIRLSPRYFATPERQVRYVLSFLRGDAQNWFEPKQQIFDRYPDRCPELATLDSLFDALRLHYGEIDEEQRAAKAIMSLQQTGSAARYATEFQRLWAKLPAWAEATMATLFFNGLRPNLRVALVAQGVTETATSLDMLISRTVKLDNQLYDLRIGERTTSNSSYHGPAPMELGQLERGTGRQRRPHLSEAARNFRRRNGACYNCGEQGHLARDCRGESAGEPAKN